MEMLLEIGHTDCITNNNLTIIISDNTCNHIKKCCLTTAILS